MTELVQVPLEKLRPNPDQVRRTFHRIHELAESIAEHGLLQNLVVKPPDSAGSFEIVAGERRYRALTELAKQGRLKTHDVSCFVIGTNGTLENIIENVLREDVPLWELGRKYLNLYESGLTQLEIGARIGRTQGHVSSAMILARNLAPAVIVRLSKLPPSAFPAQRLMRLAALLNEDGEPDEETQLRLFQQMLAVPGRKGRRASRTRTEKEAVWDRYQRLKQGKVGLAIDPVYQPFLEAVLKYLAGENRGISA
jgi:ParB family chromosome partitioning protein